MGDPFDQMPCFMSFQEDPTSDFCKIRQMDGRTKSCEFNTSLAEVIMMMHKTGSQCKIAISMVETNVAKTI